jgi:sugar lactone lactonase YvrE
LDIAKHNHPKRFFSPRGLAMDSSRSVYFSDRNFLNKILSDGSIKRWPVNNASAFELAPRAKRADLAGLWLDSKDNMYVCDSGNHVIWRLAAPPDGRIALVAGNGAPGYVDGPGLRAQFGAPSAITGDMKGNLYVCDSHNNAIRRISPQGTCAHLQESLPCPVLSLAV